MTLQLSNSFEPQERSGHKRQKGRHWFVCKFGKATTRWACTHSRVDELVKIFAELRDAVVAMIVPHWQPGPYWCVFRTGSALPSVTEGTRRLLHCVRCWVTRTKIWYHCCMHHHTILIPWIVISGRACQDERHLKCQRRKPITIKNHSWAVLTAKLSKVPQKDKWHFSLECH